MISRKGGQSMEKTGDADFSSGVLAVEEWTFGVDEVAS